MPYAYESMLGQVSETRALRAYLRLSKNYFELWHRGEDLTWSMSVTPDELKLILFQCVAHN